jgi:uncharacterized 2Fe-2S/4Fe-4S cluster protein (DUF4445 family)
MKTRFIHVDLALAGKIPNLLRQNGYGAVCVLFKHADFCRLIDVKAPNDPCVFAGLAVDLGTTRVVMRLVHLENGHTLWETAFDNPQIEIGPDVLTRIHFSDGKEGLTCLNRLIIDGLIQNIEDGCRQIGIQPEDIYLLSLAGNTAMTHLFLGLDPHWMIREPYIPVVNRPGFHRAKDLGIKIHPRAGMFIFPNVGSYFGGDLIAGILYAGLNQAETLSMLVDVGTNAEVVLGNKHWLMACAGAAGPALEGGVTRMGMMAGPGVIDRVVIDPETFAFDLHTIAEAPPKGICGSGLIDLAAQLFLTGMMDIRGRLVASVCKNRLVEKDGLHAIVIVPAKDSATGEDLWVGQADLDSLIRSKAAMYTILETITQTVGVGFKDLEIFYVAGTFGSFINPTSAISIGMIPDLPLHRYKAIGNSSLEGATLVLFGEEHMAAIDEIRDKITYLELNVNQDFMNRFSAAKFLPHTNPELFPSVPRKK